MEWVSILFSRIRNNICWKTTLEIQKRDYANQMSCHYSIAQNESNPKDKAPGRSGRSSAPALTNKTFQERRMTGFDKSPSGRQVVKLLVRIPPGLSLMKAPIFRLLQSSWTKASQQASMILFIHSCPSSSDFGCRLIRVPPSAGCWCLTHGISPKVTILLGCTCAVGDGDELISQHCRIRSSTPSSRPSALASISSQK